MSHSRQRKRAMSTELATTNRSDSPGILPSTTTDSQVVYMWVNKKSRSTNTRSQYERIAKQFFTFIGKPLSTVDATDLQIWTENLTGTPATVKAKIATIKSMFSFAVQSGYLRLNPAIMTESPKVADRKHRKVLTEEQLIKLVNAAGNARDEAILRTLYSSGCRVSELCNLTWADVVPTEDGKANLKIVGKRNKERTAGISAATYAAILALRPMVEDDKLPVFLSNRGNKMDRTVIHRLIEQAAKRAGIDKDVSAHWFRHSHATHALKRGANVVDVQEQLGHSSLTVTTGYAHRQKSSADSLAI